jgi:Spy/CpxP family protein refolding chaperone
MFPTSQPSAFMKILVLTFALAFASPAAAQHGPQHGHGAKGHGSPYAGQESRDIKALSEQEVKDLLGGAGMGFAKAAELNRYPGPMHALELADPLELTPAQRGRLAALLKAHKERARELGVRVVELERQLDRLFASAKADAAGVDRLSAAIGEVQGRLRAEHLRTHLETTAQLTSAQVERYVTARGYLASR